MTDGTRKIDHAASGSGAIADTFVNQIAYCRANGAPITGRICQALLTLLERGAGGPVLDRVRGWTGAPLADALPLRIAGGLHALHLEASEPQLSAIYRDLPGVDDLAVVADVLQRRGDWLLPWLDGPPQTNEAGRSASFVAAMLWLAQQGLPPRFACIEIGSSAGINLMLARYRYELGGVALGPADAAMRIAPEWRGAPPPAGPIALGEAIGCDVAPVDLTDPAQALRLKAYIWPEATERFARLEAAIAAAREKRPRILAQNAAEFVEGQLAVPQPEGTTRVLMHSIVWQYVPADQQARVTAAMEAAGASATPDRPLAWIALEANRVKLHHELVVRYWPGGGEPVLLGAAHAHGAWVDWRGG